MPAVVLSLFGPKGGVGKTVLAANLACALARAKKGKVLLLDADLRDCGDIAMLLGTDVATSVADLAAQGAKISPETFEKTIPRHDSGIHLLPLVRHLRKASQLTPEQLGSVLDTARERFDFIVADCGSDLRPPHVKIFEVSSLILFVTTAEILTLSRSVSALAEIQSLAFPSNLVHLVVNRFDPQGVISESIVRQKLKKDTLALLPDEAAALTASIHQGVPLVSSQPRAPYSKAVEELARRVLSNGMLRTGAPLPLKAAKTSESSVSVSGVRPASSRPSRESERDSEIRMRVHQKLIELMDFRKLTPEELTKQDEKSLEDLRAKTREVILSIVDKLPELKDREERQRITKEVLDEALGLGPLEDLLADPSITEILVNRVDQIYIERSGKLELTPCRFTSDKHLLGVIERIVAPIGRRIDEKTPMVDARLRDGSRVHAIIPPLALDGPMVTIRKFNMKKMGPSELVRLGALTDEIADFLRACVQARLNIVISGGTGSGKTTLLNVLAGFIPSNERIVTVEDAAELHLPQEHVGRLEARPANLQGEGAIPIRELVRNTLRMRPDRIIVGECRGAEALDMLQAMNTGHDGSLTTVHANSPRDCVSRLETLVMFAGLDLPSRAIREQIVSAVQVVVQLSRLSDGSRKITSITEITGLEGANVQLQELFSFRQKGLDPKGKVQGEFVWSGLMPSFLDLFKQKGIALPKSLRGGGKS